MKLEQKVQIKNKSGLHARPAVAIVKLLQDAKSSVEFSCKRDTINARSILGILTLAAEKNSHITITVDGEDARMTMERLITAFETGFGEDVI